MSVNGKLILAVKMLLEREQYKADLNQAVADTQGAASRIEGGTRGIADAVQEVVGGQSTAVSAASRALTVLGPAAAAAVAAAVAVGAAYHQAHQETLGYEKAIILTGNAAGVTSGQLADMARSIDGVVGTHANAAAALTAMTASGDVARENLEKVSLAAIEMDRATGQSLSDTAKLFSSLGDEPVKASLRLNESMHYLTASTYAQIKAADDLGDKEIAASVAQNALADALRDRAAKIEQNLGILERSWRSVRDLAKEAWDAMVGIGRPDTLAQQRERADNQVTFLQKQIGTRKDRGLATGDLDGQLAAAQALQQTLRETAKLDERAAATKRELAAQDAARIELAQALEQSASKQVKMAQAVAQANALADRAGASAAEREQLVNAAREKYAEKASKASRAGLSDAEREAASIASLSGLTSDYQQKLTELQRAREKGNISEERYIELVEALIAKQPMAKKLMDDQAKAITAAEKATLELAKARDKDLAAMQSGVDKARAAVVVQEEQNARLGLTKEAIADLDAAKLEMLATDLELQAIAQMDKNLDEQRYDLLKQQAQAYRDLAKAKREGAAKQAGIDAQAEAAKEADRMAAEVQRAAERIEQSLTDSLMRGFEAGKDFGRNMADAIVNMFKTMVLRPVISFILSPISNIVSGVINSGLSALGLGGNLLGGSGSVLGALGSVGSSIAGWIGSGVGAIFGGTAGNAALGAALGLGSGSAAAAAAGASVAAGGTGAGAGLGAFLGSNAIPILGGAVAAITMLARATRGETRVGGQFGVAFDGEVDNNRRGQTYTYQGQQYDRDFSGGRRDPFVDGQAYRLEGDPVKDEGLIRQAVSDTAKGINQTLKALGSQLTLTGFSAGLETSGKGRGGVFAGGTLSDGTAFGESGTGDNYAGTLYELTSTNSPDYETALRNFTLDLKQSTIQALQAATDIPKSVQEMLKDVDAESLSDEAATALLTAINTQVAGVTAFREALSYLGLDELAGMAYDAAVAVAEASGGFEALGSNLASFEQNYFTEAEREDLMRKRVTETLAEVGLEMPKTRDEFRALVLELLAMGEAGAEAVAVLLSVNDEFADLTDGAASAAEALGISADGIAGIMRDAVKNASSRGEAEDMASSAFQEQFYDGILNTMTSALSEGMMSAIVGPMLNSLVGGAVASGTALAVGGATGGAGVATGGAAAGGAVAAGGAQAGAAMAAGGVAAGGNIADFITSAREYINSFVALLSDDGVRGAIGEIGGMIGDVTGDLYEGVNTFFINSKSYPAVSGAMSSAAEDATKAIQDLTDALVDEVKRIRGLVEESNPAGITFASAQAKFAIATAAARAGDKSAADELPELSRKMLDLAESNVRTAAELRYLQATTAASLQATAEALVAKYGGKLPSFDVGINEVPYDMVAQIHKGERIMPAADNRQLMAALNGTGTGERVEVGALVAAIQQGFDVLDGRLRIIAGHTETVRDKAQKWDRVGLDVKTQAGTKLAVVTA